MGIASLPLVKPILVESHTHTNVWHTGERTGRIEPSGDRLKDSAPRDVTADHDVGARSNLRLADRCSGVLVCLQIKAVHVGYQESQERCLAAADSFYPFVQQFVPVPSTAPWPFVQQHNLLVCSLNRTLSWLVGDEEPGGLPGTYMTLDRDEPGVEYPPP